MAKKSGPISANIHTTGLKAEFVKQHIGVLNQTISNMKNYDKNNESSYMAFLDTSNWYGWAMSQKLLVNGFKWVKNLSNFIK